MPMRLVPMVTVIVSALALTGCDSAVVEPEILLVSDLAPSLNMHSAGDDADVMNQGGVGVYAANGARVLRQPNGLRMSMRVPTPQPGSYTYPPNPPGIVAGHPEVFSLWAFIFNFPNECTDGVCGGDDLGDDADAKGSVYNVGGHVAAGNLLTITGRIRVGQQALAPPGITPTPLVNPSGAEVHLALTSHGALDPSTLPGEFRSPTGSPTCDCWWVGIILP